MLQLQISSTSNEEPNKANWTEETVKRRERKTIKLLNDLSGSSNSTDDVKPILKHKNEDEIENEI